MDEFESRLKGLALSKPSEDVKQGIFLDSSRRPMLMDVFYFRVPLAWAALFALFMGLAGMYLSEFLRGSVEPVRVVTVRVIEAPSAHNPFDFTGTSADFLPGELTVEVKTPEEI